MLINIILVGYLKKNLKYDLYTHFTTKKQRFYCLNIKLGEFKLISKCRTATDRSIDKITFRIKNMTLDKLM